LKMVSKFMLMVIKKLIEINCFLPYFLPDSADSHVCGHLVQFLYN